MKATLEFNLDDHDDMMAHMRCVKSLNMAIALKKIKQIKYDCPENYTIKDLFEEIDDITTNINLNEIIK